MTRRHTIAAAIWAVTSLHSAGCENNSAPPTARTSGPSPPTAPASTEAQVQPAEMSKDDPAAPGWLPKPEEIGGWVRASSVQAVYPGEWHRLKNGRMLDAAEALALRCAYSFRYTAALPQPGCAVADVVLVEGATVEDAFGLAAALTAPNPTHNLVGSRSCFEDIGDTRVVHGWQGKYYLHVVMKRRGEAAPQVSVERLAAALLRPVPSAEPPELIKCFPLAGQAPGRVWLTRRHLHIFPEAVHRDVLRGSALETTKALGLNADTLMAVVAYSPGEGERLNYVWVVKYPTPQAAAEAVGRYKSILRKIKPAPLVQMELPTDPEGQRESRYLIGTWTADQESIMHVMPQIVANIAKL